MHLLPLDHTAELVKKYVWFDFEKQIEVNSNRPLVSLEIIKKKKKEKKRREEK